MCFGIWLELFFGFVIMWRGGGVMSTMMLRHHFNQIYQQQTNSRLLFSCVFMLLIKSTLSSYNCGYIPVQDKQLWCMLLQRMTKALPVKVAWRFTTALKMTWQVLKSRPNQVNQSKLEVVFIWLLIAFQNNQHLSNIVCSQFKYSLLSSSVIHSRAAYLSIYENGMCSRYLQDFAKGILQ